MHAFETVANERETTSSTEAEHMLEDVNMLDKRDMHAASHVARRQAAAGNGDVPGAGAQAAAAGRADRRHGAGRHQQHHRPAEGDQEKRDITIAIIEHDMHVVFSLAERITVLAQGTPLVEDTPENIKGHPKVQEAYLGRPTYEREDHGNDSGEKAAARAFRTQTTPTRRTAPAFSRSDIHAYYGESYIVQGVSFNVHEGEILALLGRNGAGQDLDAARHRAARRPAGDPWRDLARPPAAAPDEEPRGRRERARLVPEDRRIIPGLTVEENLQLAQIAPPIGWSIERIYELFPRLGERRKQEGTTLSGGEQQMLAIAPRAGARHQGAAAGRTLRGPGAGDRRRDRKDAGHHQEQGITTIIVEQNAVRALNSPTGGDPRHRHGGVRRLGAGGARQRP
jgi:branched-chain amino acid transport system ATP-binding protein